MSKTILPFGYSATLKATKQDILTAVSRVLDSNKLVLGPETEAFEYEFASWLGINHCIGVHSGTTALHLALWAVGVQPGDEVITVANTCPPTITAIRLCGAVPVFADVHPKTAMLDVKDAASLITAKTKAIVAVHLWGMCVDMPALNHLAKEHGLTVIEDCAQAHGTTLHSTPVGTLGRVGCFSFYPTKNIGAYGDAGAVVTNDPELASRIRAMRTYGYDNTPGVSSIEGMNARINEIQAAILRIQLQRYILVNLPQRLTIAEAYHAGIDNPAIRLPVVPEGCSPTYHQFVVRCKERDALKAHLKDKGIICSIHYPHPVHQMPAYAPLHTGRILTATEKACCEILSLPLHTDMTKADTAHVINAVNSFNS